jgi:hypothetical protein
VFIETAFVPRTPPGRIPQVENSAELRRATLIPIPEAALIECLRTVALIDCVSAIAAIYTADEIRQIADELIELWEHLKGPRQ